LTLPFRHVPVLLRETIDACFTTATGNYVDATGGGGGHTEELLTRLSNNGKVLILDRDPQAIAVLNEKFSADTRVIVVQERFGNLGKVLEMNGWKQIHGLIADLGMSSEQVDSLDRGFSLRNLHAPLDLRMGLNTQTASEWLAIATIEEIAKALEVGGDFIHARQIAIPLKQAVLNNPELTIGEALEAGFGANSARLPANVISRFIQSLRIAVNDEYGELKSLLRCAREKVVIGGKVSVLSFHSGEAKIVKAEFTSLSKSDDPVRHSGERYWLPLKPVVAKTVRGEVARNPRASSAVLRSAVRGGVQ